MKRFILLLTLAITFVSCKKEQKSNAEVTTSGVTADLIVTNAKVAVMDSHRTITEAIAVKDGKVLKTGTTEEVLKLQGANTKTIDANKRTLIPGLNDSHLHLTRGGRFYNAELR